MMARGDGEELKNLSASAGVDVDPVPIGLKEVMNLLNSINRRLEDCAVEFQSNISRKQWRILESKSVPATSWEKSLLARTFFVDKNLDDNYQKLLNHARNLASHLNTFFALLRGEHPVLEESKDAQNQCSGDSSLVDEHQPKNPVISPIDLTLLDENNGHNTGRRRSKRLAANALSSVRQSFADLIKAKIELDTKFLGFEAVLNSSGSAMVSPNDVTCLCQICSNVLESVIDETIVSRDLSPNPQVRVTRLRNKRLARSPKVWNKKSDKKQTMSIARIPNQSPKKTEDPPME